MNDALRPPRLSVEKENGQLMIAPETPAPVATMLKETLGKASQSYVAHESQQDDRQQYLLDRTGRVFQVSTDPRAGLVALHSSTAMLDAEQPPASLFGHLSEAGLPTGDRNYLALATGIHRDVNGDHWRVHDDKLHKLSSERQWHPDRPDINKLAPGRDGGLYGLQSSTQIIDLATGRGSETTPHPIAAFTIDRQGEVAQVLKPDNGGNNFLRLLPSLGASPEQALDVTPRYAPDTPIPGFKSSDVPELTSIAFSERALFAIDKENRVLMAPLPQQGQTEVNFQALPQAELQNALGKDIQFVGFTHHGDGELSLLSKDHSGQGQLHVGPLDASGKAFRPGWNLSDILHIDSRRGLDVAPDGMRLQEFNHAGQLGLADGKLYAKDKLTQQWSQVGKKIDGLQRGLDGQAYALQEGKLKKVGVEEKSPVIGYGDSNVFTLTQTRGKATLKDGPKNAPKETLKAAAVLGQYRHVTLSEAGKLRYIDVRPGTSSEKHPPVTIGTQGLEGEIRQLSVDKNERLFALTSEGKLYSLAASDWQKPRFTTPAATWQPESLPEGTGDLAGATLSSSRDYHGELILASGERLKRQDHGWVTQASERQEAPTTSARDRMFSDVIQATTMFKPSGMLPTVTASTEVFGISELESTDVSNRYRNRLSAVVFEPSWKTPRPIKTATNFVQHRWQGREGLRPLYEQESALFKQLDAINTQLKSGLAPERGLAPEHRGMDLKTRLQRLDLGPAGSELKEALESFRESLELSARKQLIKLGKHQGVLDRGGKLKTDYQTPKLKSSIQAFNPNRSGHDLSKELLALWQHCPASPDNDVGQLLKDFRKTGVNMSHQATDVPLGRRRDPNDKMALSKSRLALDTLTLLELDQLVKEAERIPDQGIAPKQLNGLKHELAQLRDHRYENHRAKYYTDHGMSGHHDVEGRYDTAKAFIKAFSNPRHSINLVASAALRSESQQDLNSNLKAMLHSLKPSDDVMFTRNYGVSVTPSIIPTLGLSILIPIGGTLNQQRNYVIEFNGVEDGVEINLSRNLQHSISIGVGVFDTPEGGALAASANLAGKASSADHNEFIFKLHGKDIDSFVDGLTSGQITPDELVDKGLEHVAMHGRKWEFNLDLSASLGGRLDHVLTEEGSNTGVTLRGAGAASASLNLFSTKRDNLHYEGIESTKHRTNNTTGFLNNASLTVGATPTLSVFHEAGDVGIPVNIPTPANLTLSIDNSVKVRGEMQTKRAEPITSEAFDKLIDSLTKAFPDPGSQRLLDGIKNLAMPDKPDALDSAASPQSSGSDSPSGSSQERVGEKLTLLKQHFLNREAVTPHNDSQYAALRSLESTSLQHQAARGHGEVMSAAKMVVSHANPHHLDHQGVLNFLVSLVAPSRKDALASQIGEMMKNDPTFATLINDIRSKPNCYTWVTLELKDDVRHRLEESFLEGKTSLSKVKAALSDPQNRRLKSITLLETGQHKEGFTLPTPLVSGSHSASVYMERSAGTIEFTYGADQDTPRSYALSGEAASSKPEIASAMTALKQQGLDIRDQ
ncbi:AvrE-family type 3 secretion system effector [Billgrantia sp. Q4P2]|uniref:AvrE-family type 3 secretion system effector n=1 Tax=Billgrantia sp. Q4P2 TaxID=3463857 RepID=UPI00405636A9